MATVLKPHGGVLCELILEGELLKQLHNESTTLLSFSLNQRQLCDTELLLNGGFSPLRGFLNKEDYDRVVKEMRLTDGTLWPIPVTFDVSQEQAENLKINQRVALRDFEGNLIAVLTVESIYVPDKVLEAQAVFGTVDELHPAVNYLMKTAKSHYVGGKLEGAQLPPYYDFVALRKTPRELRSLFASKGLSKVVGFQTRNPLHKSHLELTVRAAKSQDAHLLLHPSVGMTKPGDVDHYTRVRCYRNLMQYYPEGMATLSLLPLAMRMGGPREAVWHAIIRKNYGCTHFIVGRDHAGPGDNSEGKPFYGPYDAQVTVSQFANELEIKIVLFKMVAYVPEINDYLPEDEVKPDMTVYNISGTELRRRLMTGEDIPAWFSFPEIVSILRESYPQRSKQGLTIFFTGLSGSGKSTVGNALMTRLMEYGNRSVSLLDGDVVRTHLSSELGFSKEHRDINIRRIGFVASEITKAGGIAVTAAIAPYSEARRFTREAVSQYGGFFEVYLSTPIEVCEARDRKGLYAKARAGILKGFTGIDDPYEIPVKPELNIDTSKVSVSQAVDIIVELLVKQGFLSA